MIEMREISSLDQTRRNLIKDRRSTSGRHSSLPARHPAPLCLPRTLAPALPALPNGPSWRRAGTVMGTRTSPLLLRVPKPYPRLAGAPARR